MAVTQDERRLCRGHPLPGERDPLGRGGRGRVAQAEGDDDEEGGEPGGSEALLGEGGDRGPEVGVLLVEEGAVEDLQSEDGGSDGSAWVEASGKRPAEAHVDLPVDAGEE